MLLAIALVLCAVFVPVALLGGISGVMFRQFGLTVAVSVLLSALRLITLTVSRLWLKQVWMWLR